MTGVVSPTDECTNYSASNKKLPKQDGLENPRQKPQIHIMLDKPDVHLP